MSEQTTSKALSNLSPEELAMLEKDRKGGSTFPILPMIRLANKDAKQAKEGSYFIETRKGKDEDPEIKEIGNNPEGIILYKTSTYSYFTPEDGLIAWTSDIHGFTAEDRVTLYRKKNGQVSIDFDGLWPEFRKHMDNKYCTIDPITDKKKKLLKFKNVLYVLYEGSPYKIFVSNASAVGVDSENRPSFETPQEQSLQHFESQCWNSKHATYEFRIELGSKLVQSTKPFYLMTFSVLGENDEQKMKEAIRARVDTEKAIFLIDDARKRNVLKETESPKFAEEVSASLPVSIEDLPF